MCDSGDVMCIIYNFDMQGFRGHPGRRGPKGERVSVCVCVCISLCVCVCVHLCVSLVHVSVLVLSIK